MKTLQEQLVQVIYASVTVLNGEQTEEDLNMLISETIAKDNFEEIKKNLLVGQLTSETDVEKYLDEGVYVYSFNSITDWTFNRHDTIADAVREAIKLFNATILYNGEIITYDSINNESAYYVDDAVGKVKIVQLCA